MYTLTILAIVNNINLNIILLIINIIEKPMVVHISIIALFFIFLGIAFQLI